MNNYKKALKDITYELCRNKNLCKFVGDNFIDRDFVLINRWQKKVDLLNELVEKNTPVKIEYKSCCDDIGVYDESFCPICHYSFGYAGFNDGYNYCPRCGHRLDWSEE